MSSTLKTAVLLAFLSGLFIVAGGALFGQSGVLIAFVLAVAMNIGSYWFSDKIVLRMYRAQEVGPDHPLHRMTARLAQKAGLPMPKVYLIPDMSPNAFATGRNPEHAAVAATEGILRLLPESELEGVIAHELAHVKHRDILISTVAATIGAAITMLGYMAWFIPMGSRDDDRGGSNPLVMLALVLLAPIAATIIQLAISRQREFGADRGGAEIAGSPMGLASALRRIEAGVKQIPMDANPATAHMFIMSPFAGVGGIAKLFSSHPPTEERVKALMALRGL
ncbi:MAG TPA: zinc metalloprotease HtpX [Vicinamibacterales bacterium]|nr:zinc metalloprotease HtpX [Vicinamibacterales bacterium]